MNLLMYYFTVEEQLFVKTIMQYLFTEVLILDLINFMFVVLGLDFAKIMIHYFINYFRPLFIAVSPNQRN